MTGVLEVTSVAWEATKPIYGTLRRVYSTRNDRKQFLALVEEASKQGGLTEQQAESIREAMKDEIGAAQRRSKTGIRRFTWPMRVDRGPGIDRLPTLSFLKWLDDIYLKARARRGLEKVGPESISQNFWNLLGEAFAPGQPDDRSAYSRKLRNELERNDREHKSYLATTTMLTSGLAGSGVAGALAYGASGAADADLKGALAALAGITLTAWLGTLMRALQSRLSARPAAIGTSNEQSESNESPGPR